jgi:Cft2 family RNA processing exonuclease
VYLTGLARAFARLYDQTRFVTPRCDPELRLERLPFQVLEPEAVDSGVPLERPSLLIASSGMVLPNTASSRLARRMLPEPRHAVFFVGYLDPDTPGHRVAEAPPGADVDLGDGLPPVPVCCRVERFRFGAHSSRRSLLGMLDGLRPGRLALVHGEPAAADALAAAAGDSTRMVALQIDRETVWD